MLKLLNNNDIPVVGGIGDGVQSCTREVGDGDQINVGSLTIDVIFAPSCS